MPVVDAGLHELHETSAAWCVMHVRKHVCAGGYTATGEISLLALPFLVFVGHVCMQRCCGGAVLATLATLPSRRCICAAGVAKVGRERVRAFKAVQGTGRRHKLSQRTPGSPPCSRAPAHNRRPILPEQKHPKRCQSEQQHVELLAFRRRPLTPRCMVANPHAPVELVECVAIVAIGFSWPVRVVAKAVEQPLAILGTVPGAII